MQGRKMQSCEECGDGGGYHRLTYITVAIDDLIRPLFTPGPLMRFFSRGLYGIERRTTPHLFTWLIRAGIAKREVTPDDGTILLARMLWEEANVRGIKVSEVRLFGLPRNLFLARFPARGDTQGKLIAYEGIPFPLSGTEAVWWMDNKAVLKKKFRKFGFPVARGGEAFTRSQALKLYRALTPPVIVKPHSGSGSRHTILHINNETEFIRAFEVAKQVAPFALIEEELVGSVYRATVVDGVFAAALRRDPPQVMGDGTHTIEELIEIGNRHPARSGPYFSKLTLNDSAKRELAWQGYTRRSVPAAGKRVALHQKINWSVGGTTSDATDEVHGDNIELFEEVARVLRAPIVGIDFIIGDLTRSWKEQERCGILECNSMPFFDNHHLPFEGEPRNVAGLVWDMVEP